MYKISHSEGKTVLSKDGEILSCENLIIDIHLLDGQEVFKMIYTPIGGVPVVSDESFDADMVFNNNQMELHVTAGRPVILVHGQPMGLVQAFQYTEESGVIPSIELEIAVLTGKSHES